MRNHTNKYVHLFIILTFVLFNEFCALLKNRVALVTGATRGIGKGIARGLIEQGCTVYITGRSLDDKACTEPSIGGTLISTALELNGINNDSKNLCHIVACDHNNDTQVELLINQIKNEQGRLDILVNNAFAVPSRPDGKDDDDLLFRNFWELPGWFYDAFMNVGLRSHYIASVYATPLMFETACNTTTNLELKAPLIAMVSSFGGISYSFNVAYGAGKAAVDRLAKDMNIELSPRGINTVSLWPGVVRTERMESLLDSGRWEQKTGLATINEFVESPTLTGRVLAHLYDDKNNEMRSRGGKVVVVAEEAKKMGVTDIDGLIKPSIRSLKFLIPSLILASMSKNNNYNDGSSSSSGSSSSTSGIMENDEEKQKKYYWWKSFLIRTVPDVLLPMAFMEGGAPAPSE